MRARWVRSPEAPKMTTATGGGSSLDLSLVAEGGGHIPMRGRVLQVVSNGGIVARAITDARGAAVLHLPASHSAWRVVDVTDGYMQINPPPRAAPSSE